MSEDNNMLNKTPYLLGIPKAKIPMVIVPMAIYYFIVLQILSLLQLLLMLPIIFGAALFFWYCMAVRYGAKIDSKGIRIGGQ